MSNLVKVRLNPERFLKFDLFLIEYPGLSGFAKWVYSYIASRPPSWRIYATEIAKHCTEGLDRVKAALAELQAFGLLLIEQTRDPKTNRFTGKLWRLLGFTRAAESPKPKAIAVPGRKLDSPPTGLPAEGLPPLPRSMDLDSSSLKNYSLSASAPRALPPLPEERQGAGEIAKGKETKTQASLPADKLARLQRMAELVQRDNPRLQERQETEARLQQLRLREEAKRAAADAAMYSKYQGLEPDALIDALCADFLSNPEPRKDRRNVLELKQRYAASPRNWRGLVNAFRAAGEAGAYSVKWVTRRIISNL